MCVSVPEPTAEHPVGPRSITSTEVPLQGTTLTASDVSGRVGETVQLTATLTSGGTGVAGATIEFRLESWNATATTDANGVATTNYQVALLGTSSYAARFEADGSYALAAGIGNVTGVRGTTAPAASDVTGDHGATVQLCASVRMRAAQFSLWTGGPAGARHRGAETVMRLDCVSAKFYSIRVHNNDTLQVWVVLSSSRRVVRRQCRFRSGACGGELCLRAAAGQEVKSAVPSGPRSASGHGRSGRPAHAL